MDRKQVAPKKKEFPNEVVKKIMSKANSHKALLNFRLVSHNFKLLADEVLKEKSSLWKSTFDKDFPSFLNRVKGKRFSTAEEVSKFISEMEGCKWNPFPNGTVIFCPNRHRWGEHKPSPEELKAVDDFYDTFATLVATYQEDITTLVYCFKASLDHLQISSQLHNILQLKNLKHLAIYRPMVVKSLAGLSYLEKDRKRKIAISKLDGLIELQIFGISDPRVGSVPSVVTSIWKAVKDSCTHLQLQEADAQVLLFNPERAHKKILFDRIRKFKLVGTMFSIDLSHFLCDSFVAHEIEEFSLKLRRREPGILLNGGDYWTFRELFNWLEANSKLMKKLHFDIEAELLLQNTLYPRPKSFHPFRKLNHLILDYKVISTWKSLMAYGKQKFSNLEELTILVGDEFGKSQSPREFYSKVMELWTKLPESLKVIHVPYFMWSLRKSGNGSVYF